jgi:hypothetical protein
VTVDILRGMRPEAASVDLRTFTLHDLHQATFCEAGRLSATPQSGTEFNGTDPAVGHHGRADKTGMISVRNVNDR